MLNPGTRRQLEPPRQAMQDGKRRLDQAWTEWWSLVGDPNRDASLLDRIAHAAMDVVATARAQADIIRREGGRR